MKKQRRRMRKGNHRAMMCITVVVAVLLVSLTIQSQSLVAKNASYEEQESELEAQIAAEEERAEEIAGLEEYMQSDEYIEKIARDKLGLVYPDEILIKPED